MRLPVGPFLRRIHQRVGLLALVLLLSANLIGCSASAPTKSGFDSAQWQYDLSSQYFRIGKTYAQAGRWQEAIQQYSLALTSLNQAKKICEESQDTCTLKSGKYDTNRAKILARRALAHVGGSQLDRALADATEAVDADPNYANGHYVLGGIYAMNGDAQMAGAQYRLLQRLNKPLADALARQLQSMEGAGRRQ